jgi:hypothetical protein
MTIPDTIRLKQSSEALHIRYRPNNDSWRYLLLFFALFCLSPIVFEAYTIESTFLYATVGVGVIFSVYVVLSREAFFVSVRSPKQPKDPYRNTPLEPLLFVGRQQVTPPGATLTGVEAEVFEENDHNGAPIRRYKLIAVYNTSRLILMPRINKKEEVDAMLSALSLRLNRAG